MDCGLEGIVPTYKTKRGRKITSTKEYKAGLEKIKLEILERQKLEEENEHK